jgi:hypothetical protein
MRSAQRSRGMNAPNDTDTHVEAILDDLYANEINVSLSWNMKRGFHATLGESTLAEAFRTSAEAARWLKQQASDHFRYRQPASTRSAERNDNLSEEILDDLCTSDISGSISWIWDNGFHVTLGEPKVAEDWFSSSGETLAWLGAQALTHFPDTPFARKHAGLPSSAPSRS